MINQAIMAILMDFQVIKMTGIREWVHGRCLSVVLLRHPRSAPHGTLRPCAANQTRRRVFPNGRKSCSKIPVCTLAQFCLVISNVNINAHALSLNAGHVLQRSY